MHAHALYGCGYGWCRRVLRVCVIVANGTVQDCGAGDEDQGILEGRSRAASEEGPGNKREGGNQMLANRVYREAEPGGVSLCARHCML